MIKFLFIVFMFFVLLIFLLGFSFARGLKNLFFGPSDRKQTYSRTSQQHQKQPNKEEKEEVKIARKLMEDAEYVEFEEIKDSEKN